MITDYKFCNLYVKHHCACPFYSSRAGFFGKAPHHSGLSAPLQPRFGSLRLLAFPKAKIVLEKEEICECEGHTIHKLSHRRLTADWLAPQKITVDGQAVRSPLTGCQVTSRPRDGFSRYSKRTDPLRTVLVFIVLCDKNNNKNINLFRALKHLQAQWFYLISAHLRGLICNKNYISIFQRAATK